MLSSLTLALTAAEFGNGPTPNVFNVVLIGFSFVFLILLFLSYMTSILGKIFARMSVKESSSLMVGKAATNSKQSSQPSALSKEPKSVFTTEENDPHFIAVVAAAIHCSLNGQKHRIVSIRSSDSNWAAEGRRQIFSSHNLR